MIHIMRKRSIKYAAVLLVLLAVLLAKYAVDPDKADEYHNEKGILSLGESERHDETEVLTAETSVTHGDKEVEILDKYREMYERNPDMCGYIYLPNGLEYPIMFTPYNQNYYIDHNFDNENSKEGLPFLNRYSVIGEAGISLVYGHNLRSGKAFSVLKKYLDDDYFDENRFIQIDTLYEEQQYEVAAVVMTSLHETFKYYEYIGFMEDDDFGCWKSEISKYVVKGSLEGLKPSDIIMEASTCYYHKKDGRLVVILKAVLY